MKEICLETLAISTGIRIRVLVKDPNLGPRILCSTTELSIHHNNLGKFFIHTQSYNLTTHQFNANSLNLIICFPINKKVGPTKQEKDAFSTGYI